MSWCTVSLPFASFVCESCSPAPCSSLINLADAGVQGWRHWIKGITMVFQEKHPFIRFQSPSKACWKATRAIPWSIFYTIMFAYSNEFNKLHLVFFISSFYWLSASKEMILRCCAPRELAWFFLFAPPSGWPVYMYTCTIPGITSCPVLDPILPRFKSIQFNSIQFK